MDYLKAYEIYKKLPTINLIVPMVLAFVWGIIDWIEWFTEIGSLEFGGFILWLIIGAVIGVIAWFYTYVCISATIIRTDTILQINHKLSNNK